MSDTFEKINWNNRLSVGVAEIDTDHQRLIQQYNVLIERLAKAYDPNSVMSALEFLNDYILIHFDREEALMKRVGYPALELHVAAHEHLKRMVQHLYARFMKDKSLAVAEAVASLAGEWLTQHILCDDRAIGDYIRRKGIVINNDPAPQGLADGRAPCDKDP